MCIKYIWKILVKAGRLGNIITLNFQEVFAIGERFFRKVVHIFICNVNIQ
jgi:hypothetical protein